MGAFVQSKYGIDLIEGSAHSLGGLILFAVCLALVISTDRLLHLLPFVRGRTEGHKSDDSQAAEDAKLNLGHPRVVGAAGPGWTWLVFAAAFVSLGAFTHARVKDCWPVSRLPGQIVLTPPAKIGEWELVETSATFSERTESFAKYAHRWRYRRDALLAEIALTYPFTTGYHDPAVCYMAGGWTIAGRASHPRPDATGSTSGPGEVMPYFELHMTKLSTTHGHLLFAAFDEHGRWQSPISEAAPSGSLSYRIWLSRRAGQLLPTHDLQALVVSSDPLDAEQKRQAEQLFLEVRTELARQALAALPNGRGKEDVR
jgi:hypothetical protein